MSKYFNIIIEKDSDGFFIASVAELKGCHTQAKSLDQLIIRIKEVIELCLEVQSENFDYEYNEFVGVQRIAI